MKDIQSILKYLINLWFTIIIIITSIISIITTI